MKKLCKVIVPPLLPTLHKGQAGRIAIIGGCQEYTGAPYFAGITALRLGADLVHVMCTPAAAGPIKAYCPDLMVLPILSRATAHQFNKWVERLHCVVIGPGLGRDQEIISIISDWINVAKQRNIPIIIDADGLFIVTKEPELVKGYEHAILTPNIVEFERLYYALTGDQCLKPPSHSNIITVTNKLKCSIICKGAIDLICTKNTVIECVEEGSNRRCGGQGDLLSGAIGLFSYWARNTITDKLEGYPYQTVAAFAASSIVKRANYHAFNKRKRAMITSDMIDCLPKAFDDVFETE